MATGVPLQCALYTRLENPCPMMLAGTVQPTMTDTGSTQRVRQAGEGPTWGEGGLCGSERVLASLGGARERERA